MKMKIFNILFLIVTSIILFLSTRGILGNPNSKEVNTPTWKEGGPFELSPERGRFALLYSIVEDKSMSFSVDIARFATPDLGYKDGKYVSLFAPVVSYIAAVGYIIGKYFGASQVGAFAIIGLFALFNGLLIRRLIKHLTENDFAANLGALVYLFATPSFAYSVTLYQHQISTFLILAALNLLTSTPKVWKLFLIYFLCAASIPVDYPNLFLMAPIGIYALGWLVNAKVVENKINLKINPAYLLGFLGLVLPLIFFFWFNYNSYGDPLQLSGTVASVAEIDKFGNSINSRFYPTEPTIEQSETAPKKEKRAVGFFKSRYIANGLFIHLFSPDRGIIYFTPVILLGLLGVYFASKSGTSLSPLMVAVIGANILLYSMWGDPWGGWAFGSRYLIPSYALLSIFLGVLLAKFNRNIPLFIIFTLLCFYSVDINTIGALSTSAVPPKVQVLELEKISGVVQKYNHERGLDMLKNGKSKSFFYSTYLSNTISALDYYKIITGSILVLISSQLLFLVFSKKS